MFSKINKRTFTIGLFVLLFVLFLLFNNYHYWLSPIDPATNFVKEYYIQNAVHDTHAANAITAILLEYRLFDTLFETMLLFVSVIAVVYFSRHKGEQE